MRWSIIALAGALTVGSSIGCSHQEPSRGSTSTAHPTSVTVDFFHGNQATAVCSGTLISANVVLTAAHCADGSNGAFVTAPEAKGKTSTVTKVYLYGWDKNYDHTLQNDLALLVLRTPIALPKYAAIQQESCDGCGVSAVHRLPGSHDLAETGHMKLAAYPTSSHPLAMYAPLSVGDSGGAVLRTDGKGKGLLVGVTIGDGQKSGGSYVARVDDPQVQRWIHDIVYVARPPAGSTGTKHAHTHSGGIKLLDDNSCAADGDGCSTDDDCCNGSCDSNSGTCGSADDSSQQCTNDGDSCSQDSDCCSGTCDPNAGTCGYQDPVQSDNGTDSTDQSTTTDNGETQSCQDDGTSCSQDGDCCTGTCDQTSGTCGVPSDPSAQSDNTDPNQPTQEPSGDTIDESGSMAVGDPTQMQPSDGTDMSDASNQFDETDTGIRTGTDRALTTSSTDHSWTAFPDMDEFGRGVQSYVDNNPNMNVVGAHGNVGYMEDAPSAAQLMQMAMNGNPIVLGSCYGGASTGGDNPTSNAADIANDAGVDPGNVYACGRQVTATNNQMQCDGDWIDANGNQLSDAQRQAAGLQNCRFVPASGGRVYVRDCR